jgi:hypothetical protein
VDVSACKCVRVNHCTIKAKYTKYSIKAETKPICKQVKQKLNGCQFFLEFVPLKRTRGTRAWHSADQQTIMK